VDLETFRWLTCDEGLALVAACAPVQDDPRGDARDDPRGLPGATADRVAAARTQVELRRHAAAKLGDDAAVMWFTRDGLEQATRARVATHRAARMAAYDARTLVDLGCGVGGDLVAAARAGLTCVGVDLDPVRVAIAEANLAALGLPGAGAVADATALDLDPFDVAFADPARRTGRGRSFRVDDWTPPWDFVEALLARTACVKAAPGLPHERVPDGVEAEWVSDEGEVKEVALWAGRLATVRWRATVITGGGLATLTDEDEVSDEVRAVGDYLYEPDGAVIRAGLVTAVAAAVDGGRVDPHLAYVTSDHARRTPFARGYRVLEELPYREKQLRAALRERDVGALTIKKRGVGVVPEELRQRLRLTGSVPATVVLTRVAGKGTALLVEPVQDG